MKKVNVFSMFLTVVMLWGGMANSQVKKLEVKNTSLCDVFITVRMSVISATPTCSAGVTSSIIHVPSGTTRQLSADAPVSAPDYIPGVPSGYTGYILAASGLDGPTACITAAVLVGEASCTLPNVNVIYTKNLSCVGCDYVKFEWTTIDPNSHAILRVNP